MSSDEAGESRRGAFRRRRPQSPGRAGRNLPVAIAVSLLLGGLIISSLYTERVSFLGLLAVTICLALVELRRSLGHGAVRLPIVPLGVGAVAMLVGAYLRGPQALGAVLALTALAVVVWRIPEGGEGYLRDVSAGTFVAVYVPFFAGFAALLLAPEDGAHRVMTLIVLGVCSDVGGYATGVLFGRHPMAPAVSPNKTWEGFAGSAVACVAGGAGMVFWLLGDSAWQGGVLGAAVLASTILGDLGESLIKRDLGVKDMGTFLPGHGGIMDRLDSLLPSAPVAWLLLTAFVPAP